MMRQFLILQALWSMERRHADGVERTPEGTIAMTRATGFDGVSAALMPKEMAASPWAKVEASA